MRKICVGLLSYAKIKRVKQNIKCMQIKSGARHLADIRVISLTQWLFQIKILSVIFYILSAFAGSSSTKPINPSTIVNSLTNVFCHFLTVEAKHPAGLCYESRSTLSSSPVTLVFTPQSTAKSVQLERFTYFYIFPSLWDCNPRDKPAFAGLAWKICNNLSLSLSPFSELPIYFFGRSEF